MIAVTNGQAKDDFERVCDAATLDCETVFVTRHPSENVVILSESGYNNLIENLYARNSKADYERLVHAIERVKREGGRAQEPLGDG